MVGTSQSAPVQVSRAPTWGACAAALILIVQPVFFFWDVLVGLEAHIPYDLPGYFLPQISFLARCFRDGVAPLWDPYAYAGMPIHADIQAQVLYPPTWLAILVSHYSHTSLFYWVEWLVPLHMILAGLFSYGLLRRMDVHAAAALLGATMYQLGGYFASQPQHLGAICCAAWLPLMAGAVFELRQGMRPRWVAVLGLASAMSYLAGFVAATLVAGFAVVLMLTALLAVRDASWRGLTAVALGFGLGVLVAVASLVPLWQLASVSMAAQRGMWLTGGGGLPLESLVSFVVPDFYGLFDPETAFKLPHNFTMMYVYCGIAAPVLLALAPFFGKVRARVFFVLTVVCVFWMLGGNTPVYSSIVERLPAFVRGALYAHFALMAFCFFVGVTAAVVLDSFRARIPIAILWAVALYTGYDLIHTSAGRPMNSAAGRKEQDAEYVVGGGTMPLVRELQKLAGTMRVPTRIDFMDRRVDSVVRAVAMLELPTPNGDNPLVLARMLSLRRIFASGAASERLLPVSRPASPLVRMLNVEWLVRGSRMTDDEASAARLDFVQTVNGYSMYRTRDALPRFYLVPMIRRSASEVESFRMLSGSGFDPGRAAIVEGIPADRDGLATGPVTVKSYTPNRIRLSTETTGPAFLVSSESMYAGWRATVNGTRQPLLMTNGAFRGLMLPEGINDIALEYHPPYFSLYLSISGALALLAMVVAVRDAWPV